MKHDPRLQNSDFAAVFGELEETHRVRRGCLELVVVPALTLLPLLLGVVAYTESGDWAAIPICVVPPALFAGVIIRHLYSTLGDVLRIYEHGFTYQSGRRLQICRWEDVADRQHAEGEPGSPDEPPPLASVTKHNGEVIVFSDKLAGTAKIAERSGKR